MNAQLVLIKEIMEEKEDDIIESFPSFCDE